MSPLDDELRDALHARTSTVTSSPDLFAGIEARARRMKRNRAAAAVAGSALTVSALGLGGPLVASTLTGDERRPTDMASAGPTLDTRDRYALDPADPWAYRGDDAVLADGSLGTYAREWAVTKGADVEDVTFSPLFGQVYEPSAQAELVYVATLGSTGDVFWGVVTSSESGPEFVHDQPLEPDTTALVTALPGDEVSRLLVVADPAVDEAQYGPDGASEWSTMTELADGVAVAPLEGDPATDRVRVLAPGGEEVYAASAPDGQTRAVEGEGPGTEAPPGDEVPAPTNTVDWPARGGVPADLLELALTEFAETAGHSRDEVGSRLLYGGQRDGAVYVVMQAWGPAEDARVFAWRYEQDGTTASVLHGYTAPGPAVVAASLDGVLVVVPEPAAGQVLYSPDGTSEPEPVADQGTEVAVLIERPETRTGDRLLVLDGNGDPDRPIYRGTVQGLLDAQ